MKVRRGSVKTFGKTNGIVPLAHTPFVPPLASVLVLHGYQKSARTIGKTAILVLTQES